MKVRETIAGGMNWPLLRTVLAGAMLFGSFDLVIALVRERVRTTTFDLLILPLATSVVLALASLAVVALFVRLSGRSPLTASRSVALATAGGLIGLAVAALCSTLVPTSSGGGPAAWQVAVPVVTSLAVAALLWRAGLERVEFFRRMLEGVSAVAVLGLTWVALRLGGPWMGALVERRDMSGPGRWLDGLVIVALGALLFWFIRRSPWPRRLARAVVVVAFLFLVVVVARSWAGAQKPGTSVSAAEEADGRPDVVLITVDTLRADRLTEELMPNLVALGSEAVRFERALTVAPWTLPTLASLHTGLLPAVHEVVDMRQPVPLALPTLAETLAGAGYRTGAVAASVHLQFGTLRRGFDHWRVFPRIGPRSALGARLLRPVAVPRDGVARSWPVLAAATHRNTAELGAETEDLLHQLTSGAERRPYFLWLHLLDPHLPYAPPAAGLPKDLPERLASGRFSQLQEVLSGQFTPTALEKRAIEALYDAEVRAVDQALGEVFAQIRRSRRWEQTVIAVVGDHGEEFWEHDGFEHGHTFYDEVVRVPLLLKAPGRRAASEDAPRSTAGLFRSLLAEAHVKVPAGVRGFVEPSLFTGGPERAIYMSHTRRGDWHSAMVWRGQKLIQANDTARSAVFDRSTDPGDQRPLALDGLDGDRSVAQLQERRQAVLEGIERARRQLGLGESSGDGREPVDAWSLDPQTTEELKRLGYIEE